MVHHYQTPFSNRCIRVRFGADEFRKRHGCRPANGLENACSDRIESSASKRQLSADLLTNPRNRRLFRCGAAKRKEGTDEHDERHSERAGKPAGVRQLSTNMYTRAKCVNNFGNEFYQRFFDRAVPRAGPSVGASASVAWACRPRPVSIRSHHAR